MEIEVLYTETGTKDVKELSEFIKNIIKDKESVEAELATLQENSEELKAESRKTKTASTKAINKVKKLEATIEKMKVAEKDLRTELETQANQIAHLTQQLTEKGSNIISEKELKQKAKIIMEQNGLNKAFVSPEGYVFTKENVAYNHSGSKYWVAEITDSGVVLKKPNL